MPSYRTLPIDQCIIDPRYQRELIEPHIERIVREFDPAQFSVLEASERDDGTYAIFDGQQRLEARKRRIERGLEPPAAKLPSIVHTGLTPEREAELFVELQRGRRAITSVEKFKSRVFYKDPVAVGITEITDKHRLKVGMGPGSIQGVVAIERAYRRGNLEKTLSAIDIWRGDPGALDSPLIDGVSRFFDLYANEYDFDHAKKKWAEISPKTILRRASDLVSASKAGGVLRVLRDEYSDRSHPLPTIEAAVAQRIAAERASGRRYIRVSEEQVLDAVLELEVFQLGDLREKLGGVSRASLTNLKNGYLTRLRKRGVVRRRYARTQMGEEPGEYVYFVVPVSEQSRRRRRTQTTTTTRVPAQANGDKAKPPRRSKRVHPEIAKLIADVEAGGAEVSQSPSGHFIIQAPEKKRLIVKPNPSDTRAVMEEKARVRREGYPV